MPQRAPMPRAVSLLKMARYDKGSNFTKVVELAEDRDLAVDCDFTDESNFAKRGNFVEEGRDPTNRNNFARWQL